MNRIDWNGWGPAAFDRAAREGKPVLLSLVAPWSAASAEMDRSAFADPRVSDLVASRFVPVRVDADRRPDINERYNLGGCPTTAFLTPAGDILWGATFLEADGLRTALDQVSRAFAAERDTIEQRATLARLVPASPPAIGDPDPSLADWIAAEVAAPSPEPPDPTALLFLLRHSAAHGAQPPHALGRWVESLAGDVLWERPEDNAALVTFLVEASVAWDDARLRARALEVARRLRALVDAGALGCVDVACTLIEACLTASALDHGLVSFAVDALERIVGAAYRPGDGVGHLMERPDEVRGLLVDHVRAASALLTAYRIAGRLPYAMLAEELMQWARRYLWDEPGGFVDRTPPDRAIGLLARPVRPFGPNCDAARVLCRLAVLHEDEGYRRTAVLASDAAYGEDARRVLATQTAVVRDYGRLAAPCGLALVECSARPAPEARGGVGPDGSW